MKTLIVLVAVAMALTSCSTYKTSSSQLIVKPMSDTVKIKYATTTKAIIINKCYGCHNSETKSLASKSLLNFDKLSALSEKKEVSKLNKISEVLDDESMPPKRYLKKHPEDKLTDNEKKRVKEWVKATTEGIKKQ